MKKIYLFRHGETDWNKDKSMKYSKDAYDCYLNENGKEQAKKNAEFLKDKGIQHVYTSNLKRANETGKILADSLGINYSVVDGLEEFSVYDDSVIGLTRQQIRNKIGNFCYLLLKGTKDQLMDWRPLKCETKREARKRIVNAISNICKNDKNDVIAIASHGTILRQFLIANNYNDYSPMKNCEVIEAEYDNGKIKIIGRIKDENKRFKRQKDCNMGSRC